MNAIIDQKPEQDIGSVSHWLRELKAGDGNAVEAIWNRYYQRIVEFAIRKMKINPDRSVDGEDIAQITMHRLCFSLASGRYPLLDDRQQLWDLLVVFTLNRIRKHLRACNSQKRSLPKTPENRNSDPNEDASQSVVLEFKRLQAIEDLRSPEAPAIMADMVRFWLDRLDREDPSGELKQIAVWSMEDISGSEIARILKKRKSAILQKIRLIRLLWEECELC